MKFRRRAQQQEEHVSLPGMYRVGEPIRDTKAPEGPIEERWDKRRFSAKLVNPVNKRKLTVIVVGTGLAAAPPRPHSASWDTRSSRSATRTRPGGPTPSPRRAASTPPRTTAATATASTGCSTTP
ncbi:hypothetical protein GCM10027612_81230 [Microbispora bryophytorum subsp. camponoti]